MPEIAQERGRRLDIAGLTRRAWQLAGLRGATESPDQHEGSMARDLLQLIIDGLEAEGYFARALVLLDVPVVADEGIYQLPPEILDVIGTAMWIDEELDPDVADGQTQVRLIRREEYQRLASKGASSRPTLAYIHKVGPDTLELRLWPSPDRAGIVRLQAQQIVANVDDAGKAVDFERYWMPYLQWQLAHDLAVASSLSVQRCTYLATHALRHLQNAKRKATERPGQQMVVVHPTPWSR